MEFDCLVVGIVCQDKPLNKQEIRTTNCIALCLSLFPWKFKMLKLATIQTEAKLDVQQQKPVPYGAAQ